MHAEEAGNRTTGTAPRQIKQIVHRPGLARDLLDRQIGSKLRFPIKPPRRPFVNAAPISRLCEPAWLELMSRPKHNLAARSSKQVFDGFAERSWRFLAELQRAGGMEYVIGEAEGSTLWNVEHTHRLIDFGNSGGVHSLGHRNPELIATLKGALDHYDAGIWTMPTAEALSLQDAIAAFAPIEGARSVITLSATNSIDLAIMFAFRMTGRHKVLAFRHGYHGHAGYAALVTGSEGEGSLEHYSLPRSQSAFFENYDSLDSIRAVMDGDCAAVILEPMNYETFEPASPRFLPELAALCRERGALLIIDETRTGLSRTGVPWMSSLYDFAPDMLILGKGLGGGLYPVSALVAREAVYERCMNDGHWGFMSSMAGSALGSLVASKVIEIIQRAELLENVARLERAMTRRFNASCERFPEVYAPAWVRGGIAALGLRDAAVGRVIRTELFQRGVLCHSVSAIEPRVVKFFPCLTSDVGVVDELGDALDDFAAGVLRGGGVRT
jgi:putrescine aminotransferase